jgi:hypothetical protein
MKQIILGMLLITMIIFQSCDPCDGISCQNGGSCNTNGLCVCTSGFEGTSCERHWRDKFIGTWNLTTTFHDGAGGVTQEGPVTVTISAGDEQDIIKISSLKGFDTNDLYDVTFRVSGNKLTNADPFFLANDISNFPPVWIDFNSSDNPKFAISQIRIGLGQVPNHYYVYEFN